MAVNLLTTSLADRFKRLTNLASLVSTDYADSQITQITGIQEKEVSLVD